MPEINWIAVIVATLAAFATGALWYSPLLFVNAWKKEIGLPDTATGAPSPKMIVVTLILLFAATSMFAMFLGPSPGFAFGLGAGFAAGLFWVAAINGVHYLFEQRSLKTWLINGGYDMTVFTVIGAVLGAFP